MPRLTVLAAIVGAASLLGASVAIAGAPSDTAVAQIRAFAKPVSATSKVTPVARAGFAHAWNHRGANGRSVLSTLDLSRIRQFQVRPGGYSLVAAPTKSGGVCFLDAKLGGACIASFTRGAGMVEGYPGVAGSSRTRIRGIVPDGVSAVRFHSQSGQHFRAAVGHNVFAFVAPASLKGGIDTFAYVDAKGRAGAEIPFG